MGLKYEAFVVPRNPGVLEDVKLRNQPIHHYIILLVRHTVCMLVTCCALWSLVSAYALASVAVGEQWINMITCAFLGSHILSRELAGAAFTWIPCNAFSGAMQALPMW